MLTRRSFLRFALAGGIATAAITWKVTLAAPVKHLRQENRRMRRAKRCGQVDRYMELYTNQAFRYSTYCRTN